MSQDHTRLATRILGAIVGGGFLVLGIAELVARLEEPLPLLFWLPTLWGGGALVLLGVFRARSPSALATVLVVVGTAAGLIASFWTILMPILGLTLVSLTLLQATREDPVAADNDS